MASASGDHFWGVSDSSVGGRNDSPSNSAGPGAFRPAGPLAQTAPARPRHPESPAARHEPPAAPVLRISGIIAAGPPLSASTIAAVNAAARQTPPQWRRYIAYQDSVNVGGSLAWRANNPGNLRDAPTKIASVQGAVGHFAVFATLDDGRAAQRTLYLDKYGAMKVRDAINQLTPPSENDTAGYLAQLKAAGVDLDKTVTSQIDVLMPAVEANEGLIAGISLRRTP
jgi:hypothetical protein